MIPASVDVFPSTITVPAGSQVNRTIVPGTQRVTQLEVVGPSASNLSPLSFVTSTVTTPNLIDPVVFLNRAAVMLPQQVPAAPALLLASRCAAQNDGRFSSLVQAPRDVTPSQPGVALAAPAVLQEVETESEAPAKPTAQGYNFITAPVIEPWQGC